MARGSRRPGRSTRRVASPRPDGAPRRVLITGANSGLGLALAQEFLAGGDRVLAADLHDAPTGDLADLLTAGDVDYVRLDVRSDDDWAAARERVETAWGGLDVLVNNAGVAVGGRIDRVPMADWQWIVDINLLGVVRGCREFTPMLVAQGHGHVVNTASAAGLVHSPGMSAYNAVKAGVVAISETLLFELAPHGIDVSVVCPTFFRTNLGDSMRSSDPQMTASGLRLITSAPYSAEQIAAATKRGIDRGTFLITPDALARSAYASKRFAWPLYRREMMRAAERIDRAARARTEAQPLPAGLARLVSVLRRRNR